MWLPEALHRIGWRNSLHVTFAADGLHYLCRAPLSRGPLDRGFILCNTGSAGEPWQAWVDALVKLSAQRSEQGERLRVLLSDRFVHYQLLPWRTGISGNREWQAYATLRFKEVFGAATADWHIRVTPTLPGTSALACAVDQKLLEHLRRLGHGRTSLVSVQPHFAAAFNHWHRQLRNDSIWFGVVEPGRICLALLEGGHWQVIRNESSNEAWPRALSGMLRRLELSRNGPTNAKARLYLCGDLAGASQPEHINGIPLHPLRMSPGRSSVWEACALAQGG